MPQWGAKSKLVTDFKGPGETQVISTALTDQNSGAANSDLLWGREGVTLLTIKAGFLQLSFKADYMCRVPCPGQGAAIAQFTKRNWSRVHNSHVTGLGRREWNRFYLLLKAVPWGHRNARQCYSVQKHWIGSQETCTLLLWPWGG